eukprot:TRINITY_DN2128_c5_g1_i2.p1 TRINITY_DN2128_c5_g1~~TRINITY_DN2128_c5_g1_i2.p1  ORF type:complete len:1072 (+),score=160.51 TRINITY_DN2128_c5_g1_i2:70-3216(+)
MQTVTYFAPHKPYSAFADAYTRQIRESNFDPSCAKGDRAPAYDSQADPHLREFRLRRHLRTSAPAQQPLPQGSSGLTELWQKLRLRALSECEERSKGYERSAVAGARRVLQRPWDTKAPELDDDPFATPYHYLLYVTSRYGQAMHFAGRGSPPPPPPAPPAPAPPPPRHPAPPSPDAPVFANQCRHVPQPPRSPPAQKNPGFAARLRREQQQLRDADARRQRATRPRPPSRRKKRQQRRRRRSLSGEKQKRRRSGSRTPTPGGRRSRQQRRPRTTTPICGGQRMPWWAFITPRSPLPYGTPIKFRDSPCSGQSPVLLARSSAAEHHHSGRVRHAHRPQSTPPSSARLHRYESPHSWRPEWSPQRNQSPDQALRSRRRDRAAAAKRAAQLPDRPATPSPCSEPPLEEVPRAPQPSPGIQEQRAPLRTPGVLQEGVWQHSSPPSRTPLLSPQPPYAPQASTASTEPGSAQPPPRSPQPEPPLLRTPVPEQQALLSPAPQQWGAASGGGAWSRASTAPGSAQPPPCSPAPSQPGRGALLSPAPSQGAVEAAPYTGTTEPGSPQPPPCTPLPSQPPLSPVPPVCSPGSTQRGSSQSPPQSPPQRSLAAAAEQAAAALALSTATVCLTIAQARPPQPSPVPPAAADAASPQFQSPSTQTGGRLLLTPAPSGQLFRSNEAPSSRPSAQPCSTQPAELAPSERDRLAVLLETAAGEPLPPSAEGSPRTRGAEVAMDGSTGGSTPEESGHPPRPAEAAAAPEAALLSPVAASSCSAAQGSPQPLPRSPLPSSPGQPSSSDPTVGSTRPRAVAPWSTQALAPSRLSSAPLAGAFSSCSASVGGSQPAAEPGSASGPPYSALSPDWRSQSVEPGSVQQHPSPAAQWAPSDVSACPTEPGSTLHPLQSPQGTLGSLQRGLSEPASPPVLAAALASQRPLTAGQQPADLRARAAAVELPITPQALTDSELLELFGGAQGENLEYVALIAAVHSDIRLRAARLPLPEGSPAQTSMRLSLRGHAAEQSLPTDGSHSEQGAGTSLQGRAASPSPSEAVPPECG